MTSSLRPHLAPPEGYSGPRRSLLLAGGGIRVAYQAGVLLALEEAGLSFSHADGASGGTINLAMLLSGLSPREMCGRWRTVSVRRFFSLAPLKKYALLLDAPALGDADGLREYVFPHLGIQIQRINSAQGIAGTFNVCDFTDKTLKTVPHTDLSLELLIAGISLPVLMPAVEYRGRTYTDSVWIKDAHLMEAVRRGADEIWLVWAIGNTPEYRKGIVNQYVHMIEMSAHGALFEEFDRIREINARIRAGERVYGRDRPFKLHVIRPQYPLLLDTDLYQGRVDAAALIDMGYADARRYLSGMSADGLPFEPEVMKMQSSNALGITFREKMEGPFALGATDPKDGKARGEKAGTKLTMRASITIRDLGGFTKDPGHQGEIAGDIDFAPLGMALPASKGTFTLFSPANDPKTRLMVYELAFRAGGKDYYLAGRKEVHDDPGFDIFSDTTTLLSTLHEGADKTGRVAGAGVLTLGVSDLVRLLKTVNVTGANSPADRAKAIGMFGTFFTGQLWHRYKGFATATSWWRRLINRLTGRK